MSQENKTIYDLKLHEVLEVHDMEVVRVPGGWIYKFYNYTENQIGSVGTFVPMHVEFNPPGS